MTSATHSILIGHIVKVVFAFIAIPRIGSLGIYLAQPIMLITCTLVSYTLYTLGKWQSKCIGIEKSPAEALE